MPTTKTNLGKGGRRAKSTVPKNATTSDVLTLPEAAAYLRVSEQVVLELVRDQGLPGRKIGTEWRFLRPALNDWLRTPVTKSSKEALLAMAGAWKDDPDLAEMLQEIYQQRGRPMTEHDE